MPYPISKQRYLSDSELARLLAAARERKHKNQPRDYALLVLLANTGIRPAEALALEAADLHLDDNPPWLLLRRDTSPGPQPVTHLVIHEGVAGVLRPVAARATGRLFPMTPRQGQRVFKVYAQRAGLPPHHRLYHLRHTAAVRILKATRDVRLLQALMGHRQMSVANLYQRAVGIPWATIEGLP